MSLLTVIQAHCGRTGIPVPSTVLGSTDDQVLQLLRLLEEDGNDLAARGPWKALTFEFTHTSVAAEEQGAIATIASRGYSYIKNGTFWDRTNKLPIRGPLSDQEWQRMKAMVTAGPRYYYRIRGGQLLINPTPIAGYMWCGEYVSKYWILGADGTTYKQYFTLDSDTMLLPEELHLAGLRWRWKKEKGFEYGEDFRTYEMQVRDAMARDGGHATLCMDNDEYKTPGPGMFVPDMSWMQ